MLSSSLLSPLRAGLRTCPTSTVTTPRQLAVALSGGMDSVLLLHALVALRDAGELSGLTLSAVHVHHGLQAVADDWAAFCQQLCHRLAVPCTVQRVRVDLSAGLGMEGAARAARYQALRASAADVVVLAHHGRDQAETVLMRLLRGATVHGLAGMAGWSALSAQQFLWRPWLSLSRDVLQQQALALGLSWVDDVTNHDPHYLRGFLREQVWPVLQARQPALESVLIRGAEEMQEAASLLSVLAEQDRQQVQSSAGPCLPVGEVWSLSRLLALGEVRGRHLLAHALRQRGHPVPERDRLREIWRQLTHLSGPWRHPLTTLALAVHRDNLWWEPVAGVASPVQPDLAALMMTLAQAAPPAEGCLAGIGWQLARGQGLSRARLLQAWQQGTLCWSPRQGDDRLCLQAGRPRRSLKNLLQEAGMPPWWRPHVPLLVSQADARELIWLGGVGSAADWLAQDDEPGVMLHWHPLVADGCAPAGVLRA